MTSQGSSPKLVLVRERPIPKNPRPVEEPDLVPGEFILEIDVRPGLATPSGYDMFWLGSAKKLDLNSSPAHMGYPSTRRGFYDMVDGTTKVICPFCYQSFTTLDLENKHMQGPCQKYRARLMKTKSEPPNNSKGKRDDKLMGYSGFLESEGSPNSPADEITSGFVEGERSAGSQEGMKSSGWGPSGVLPGIGYPLHGSPGFLPNMGYSGYGPYDFLPGVGYSGWGFQGFFPAMAYSGFQQGIVNSGFPQARGSSGSLGRSGSCAFSGSKKVSDQLNGQESLPVQNSEGSSRTLDGEGSSASVEGES